MRSNKTDMKKKNKSKINSWYWVGFTFHTFALALFLIVLIDFLARDYMGAIAGSIIYYVFFRK